MTSFPGDGIVPHGKGGACKPARVIHIHLYLPTLTWGLSTLKGRFISLAAFTLRAEHAHGSRCVHLCELRGQGRRSDHLEGAAQSSQSVACVRCHLFSRF